MSKIKPLNILVLSDGIPGHENQSLGLCNWLSSHFITNINICPVNLRFKAINRLLLSAITTRSLFYKRKYLVRLLLRLAYGLNPDMLVAPQLIISTGGNTSFANLLLAVYFSTTNIYIGSLRRLNPALISAHLTLEPTGYTNNIVMDLAPTAINSPELDKQAKIFSNRACLPKKPFWLLIIGGSGSGYKYRDKDWHQLSTWANDACKNFNIQWLITTSRRTGTTAENILRSKITPENIAYAVWWGEKNEKILPALMGASQRIFVTADSMSMITEAISSSRPVNVLYTQSKNVNTRYEEALDRLYNNGYCSADNFYDSEISPVTAQESAIHTAATSLTERLVHLINNERSEIFSKDQAATRG